MTTTLKPLNSIEARRLAEKIKAGLTAVGERLAKVRAMILDLYERQGWRTMGYKSWEACCKEEFEQSVSYLNRIVRAGIVEREMTEADACAQGTMKDISERQLRELGRLDDPKARVEVLNRATAEGETSAGRLRDLVDQYHQASTTDERLDAARESAAEIERRAQRTETEGKLQHAETGDELMNRALRREKSVWADIRRARRHYRIAFAGGPGRLANHIKKALAESLRLQAAMHDQLAE